MQEFFSIKYQIELGRAKNDITLSCILISGILCVARTLIRLLEMLVQAYSALGEIQA